MTLTRAAKWVAAPVAATFAALVAASCNSGPVVPEAPRCPDMTIDVIDKYDFAADMKIQPAVSTKLRAAIDTALTVDALAESVDASLKQACVAYLADLGQKAPGTTTADACNALVQAITAARAKLGPGVLVEVDFTQPVCSGSIDAANVCASQCDPAVAAASLKSSCEPGTLEGTCDALCSGTCDSTAAAKCVGSCIGACDGKARGMCSGVCTGKCDGKPTGKKSVCVGVCDGTCDDVGEATCGGNCTGACVLTAAAACVGTCTGSCSSEMKGASCTGTVSTPKMTDECKAKCDAIVAGSLNCSTAPVFVRLSGSVDSAQAQAFKTAAEKNLPAITKLAMGLGEHVPALVHEATESIGTIQTAVKASLTNATSIAGLNGCFAKPFADVTLAGADLLRNVDLAVAVKSSMISGGPGSNAVLTPTSAAALAAAAAASPAAPRVVATVPAVGVSVTVPAALPSARVTVAAPAAPATVPAIGTAKPATPVPPKR